MGKSRIVVVSSGTVFSSSGDVHGPTLRRMLERGFSRLADVADPAEAIRAFFRPEDRIGIKINTIGGRRISTRPDLALPFAAWISEKVVPSANVLVWDRTNRELKEAGFKLSAGTGRPRVFGTDTDGMGYAADLITHQSIGSLFSTIQQDFATVSVSLAILKDHGLAGVTAGMKNYFGAVHNPNKYHDGGCDPYVAEIFDSPPVRSKHRLSILDCLTVQYHKGPSFHPQWAARYGALIFGADPVASDATGWRIIESLRAEKGLPSLAEEKREPHYLATAERLGLGKMNPGDIDLVEERI